MRDAARTLRQLLVPEVGEAGQRRIAKAVASVAGSGLAHEVGVLYAERAGFSSVDAGPIDIDTLAPLDIVTTDSARHVLAGARAAMAAIRAALVARP